MKTTDEEKPRHQKGMFKTKYLNNFTIVFLQKIRKNETDLEKNTEFFNNICSLSLLNLCLCLVSYILFITGPNPEKMRGLSA